MKNFNYIRTKEWILLVIALVITVLYLIFATPFYEMLYPGEAEYANEMYNNNMYFVVAVVSSLVVWSIGVLYYIFIDKYPQFIVWFITFIIVIALTPTVDFIYVNNEFQELNIDDVLISNSLQNFAFVNIAVCAVYYFVLSLCIKGLSKNCATTPF